MYNALLHFQCINSVLTDVYMHEITTTTIRERMFPSPLKEPFGSPAPLPYSLLIRAPFSQSSLLNAQYLFNAGHWQLRQETEKSYGVKGEGGLV